MLKYAKICCANSLGKRAFLLIFTLFASLFVRVLFTAGLGESACICQLVNSCLTFITVVLN